MATLTILSSVGCTVHSMSKLSQSRQATSLKRSYRLVTKKNKMAYRKYVEARTEVPHDGNIPVACRFFLVKLDRRSALSELGQNDEHI